MCALIAWCSGNTPPRHGGDRWFDPSRDHSWGCSSAWESTGFASLGSRVRAPPTPLWTRRRIHRRLLSLHAMWRHLPLRSIWRGRHVGSVEVLVRFQPGALMGVSVGCAGQSPKLYLTFGDSQAILSLWKLPSARNVVHFPPPSFTDTIDGDIRASAKDAKQSTTRSTIEKIGISTSHEPELVTRKKGLGIGNACSPTSWHIRVFAERQIPSCWIFIIAVLQRRVLESALGW